MEIAAQHNPQICRCHHYRALKRSKVRLMLAGDLVGARRVSIALREARKEQTINTTQEIT